MIQRFNKIEGVGRFISSKNLGGLTFDKLNLIYGGNTKGKSTLTAIFKSFQTGNKLLVSGRKSFGKPNQEIVLHTKKLGEISFSSKQWELGNPDIIIFDEDFINDNIHIGGRVEYDNHKSLNTIIIGNEGRKLAKNIEDIQNEISQITSLKKIHGNIFTNRFPSLSPSITLTKFKNLKFVENIDYEIETLKNKILDIKNQDSIRVTCVQVNKYFENAPWQYSYEYIKKSFELNQNIIGKHIADNWANRNASLDFLQKGVSLLKDEYTDCTFCGQKLDDQALILIGELGKLFSEEYLSLQRGISNEILKFTEWNLELTITQIKTVAGTIGITLNFSPSLSTLKKEIELELQKKLTDLSYKIDVSPLDFIKEEFEKVFKDYNEQKSLKLIQIGENISTLNERLELLNVIKIRHTENWEEYFEKHQSLEKRFKEKKELRETRREELDEYGLKCFEKHHIAINKVLGKLQADFRLVEFKPLKKIKGRDERLFSLSFFNQHIVNLDSEDISIPNFKNTLSESDKRLLAFSFFVSVLNNDTELQNRVVIFDDPFSSFDFERRRVTISEINEISFTNSSHENHKPIQIFILTHELDFYKWCLLKFPDCVSLEIVNDGIIDGIKKSTISRVNKEEILEAESKKDLKAIHEIIIKGEEIGDLSGWFVKCRKILEDIFTKKYYTYILDDIRSKKSIRTFTETLNAKKINNFEHEKKFNKIINLCNDLNIELHNNEFTNQGENGISVLTDFFECLELI